LVFVLGATRELDHITSSSWLFQKAIRVRKGERNSKSAQGKDHGAPLLRLSGSFLLAFLRQSSKGCVFVPWAKIGKVGSWLVNVTSAFSWRHTFLGGNLWDVNSASSPHCQSRAGATRLVTAVASVIRHTPTVQP